MVTADLGSCREPAASAHRIAPSIDRMAAVLTDPSQQSGWMERRDQWLRAVDVAMVPPKQVIASGRELLHELAERLDSMTSTHHRWSKELEACGRAFLERCAGIVEACDSGAPTVAPRLLSCAVGLAEVLGSTGPLLAALDAEVSTIAERVTTLEVLYASMAKQLEVSPHMAPFSEGRIAEARGAVPAEKVESAGDAGQGDVSACWDARRSLSRSAAEDFDTICRFDEPLGHCRTTPGCDRKPAASMPLSGAGMPPVPAMSLSTGIDKVQGGSSLLQGVIPQAQQVPSSSALPSVPICNLIALHAPTFSGSGDAMEHPDLIECGYTWALALSQVKPLDISARAAFSHLAALLKEARSRHPNLMLPPSRSAEQDNTSPSTGLQWVATSIDHWAGAELARVDAGLSTAVRQAAKHLRMLAALCR